MNEPPPPLPWGQIILMVYSWFSMILYFILMVLILKKRSKSCMLQSSFFDLVWPNAIANFFYFLFIELLMKSRRYRYFNLFDEDTPTYLAYIFYLLLSMMRSITMLGFLPVAVNRYTAFHYALVHNKIWSRRNIALIFGSIWISSFLLSFPVLASNVSFELRSDGILALDGGWFATLDSTSTGMIIPFAVCALCSLLYIKTAFATTRLGAQYSQAERRLLYCALLTFSPLVVESLRELVYIYASYAINARLISIATEAWYYLHEILCTVQCWALMLVTPSIRRALSECFQPDSRSMITVTVINQKHPCSK